MLPPTHSDASDSSPLPIPSSVPPVASPSQNSGAVDSTTVTAQDTEQDVDVEKLLEAQFEKPHLPATLPVNFIDLYTVLGLPRDADTDEIKQRITDMYLDAQKNLDHRNAKKKLHYQEIFQVMMPQARHLLLDPERRKEYDKYLEDYQEDEENRAQAARPLQNNRALNQDNAVNDEKEKALVKKVESIAPEELEERRASLWEKWEENLATTQDPLAPVEVSAPVLPERASMRKAFMEHALLEAQETERRREIEAARQRIKERRDAEDAQRRSQEEQTATRLHREYTQTASGLTSTARFTWAFGSALAVIITGFVLRRFLHMVINIVFRTYPLGGTENVDRLAIYLTILGAVYAAWKGAKLGVANIKELEKNAASARREAEVSATEIARERLQRESPNAKQYEIDVAVRAETIEQLRQVYSSSTLAMMKRNTAALWAFGVGLGTFVIGSAIVFGIHASSKAEPTNIVRGLSVMVGLILTAVASVRLSDISKKIGGK